MTANGWTLRSGQGWPGVTGASFRAENVAFIDYPAQVGNRLLRMTSSTDGTSENTYQTQICHQRKYMEGLYAARVRFSDVPVTGSDGDQIVQTFYTITPYEKPSTLITAKWILNICLIVVGRCGKRDAVTTWETVQIEPWNAHNGRCPMKSTPKSMNCEMQL